MTTRLTDDSTRLNLENRVVSEWRETISKTEAIDLQLAAIEREKERLTLEHSVLLQELEALRRSHRGPEDGKTGNISVLSKMKADIENYENLASQDEKRAEELETWCTRRSSKNQVHLETLQRRTQEIRRRGEANEHQDSLPIDFQQMQQETVNLSKEVESLNRSRTDIEESYDSCVAIEKILGEVSHTHKSIAEVNELLVSGVGDIARLAHARKCIQDKFDVYQSLLSDLQKKAESTTENIIATVLEVRESLTSVDTSDFNLLEVLRELENEGSLFTDPDADFAQEN